MRFVTVDRVQAGMVTAAPVMDRRARLLIPADVSLTDRHVQALRVWGVAGVQVTGDAPDAEVATSVSPEALEEVEAMVGARFGGRQHEHAFMRALRHAAVERALRSRSPEGVPA